MTGTLTHLCRVHALLPDAGTVGLTAIDKRPTEDRVRLRPLGLHADIQADRKHHGGYDQALYAYAQEDADHFTGELGREVIPGLFGENLRTAGIDVSGAVIGETWTIGDTVTVEVTGPRYPCQTFARFLGEQRWVRRFTETGLPGAYLRVLVHGDIGAGDAIRVERVPDHGVTVGRWLTDRSEETAAKLLGAHENRSVHLAHSVLEEARGALA